MFLSQDVISVEGAAPVAALERMPTMLQYREPPPQAKPQPSGLYSVVLETRSKTFLDLCGEYNGSRLNGTRNAILN